MNIFNIKSSLFNKKKTVCKFLNSQNRNKLSVISVSALVYESPHKKKLFSCSWLDLNFTSFPEKRKQFPEYILGPWDHIFFSLFLNFPPTFTDVGDYQQSWGKCKPGGCRNPSHAPHDHIKLHLSWAIKSKTDMQEKCNHSNKVTLSPLSGLTHIHTHTHALIARLWIKCSTLFLTVSSVWPLPSPFSLLSTQEPLTFSCIGRSLIQAALWLFF